MDTEQTVDTTSAPAAEPIGAADTPAPARDMESTIRETYRELIAAPEPETNDDKPARARAPDGKFTKTTPEGTEIAAAPPETSDATEVPAETPPAQTAPYDAYPQSWRKELQAEWTKLPPPLREEIHRREQNFLDGIKQYREPAAFGQAIGSELLPHVELFRQMQTTPVAVVRDLMQTWSGLVKGSPQDRANLIRQVAAQFGIDATSLSASATGPASSATQPSADLAPLSQELAQIKQRLEADAQERQRIEAEQASAEIESFGKDPKREHFAAVRQAMSQLLLSGQATTLQDAYDKATWLVPEVRAKVLAAEDAARRKREADQAAAARKAAAANVTRRGTPPVATKPGTMEDTIRSTLRKLSADG